MKDWNGGNVGTKIVEWKYLHCRVEVSIAETIAIAYGLPNWRAKLIVPNLHCNFLRDSHLRSLAINEF